MSSIREIFNNILFYGLEHFGRYYSSYRGYVVNNVDDEGLGRIQVKIPSVTRDKAHPSWAYPKNQMGGKGYGMQFLPLIGDLVWVEFEHGDPRFPIWNFAHYTSGDKPEEFTSPRIYGFKSPKGQTIIIDDEQEKIIINHGENEGLVKVIELTGKLNDIEDKVNALLNHYRTHMIVDPISGTAGPLMPSPPAPINLINTQQAEIENEDVQH